MNWLQILQILPWFGIVLVLCLKDENLIRKCALAISGFIFWATIKLWMDFDQSGLSFQMIQTMPWTMGVDGIALSFMVLTGLLTPICFLISWHSIKFLVKEFTICIFLTEGFLLAVFAALDVVAFYIFFESVLIPMFIIIGVWGSRSQKVQAAYYFFLYTLIGSVLMLLGIFLLYAQLGTTDYLVLLASTPYLSFSVQVLLFVSFFASFAVKIPLVPFHIWLPQAHVEAPVAGSVFLAGVLLKLGAFGLIRFSLPLFPSASLYFSPCLFTFGVIAILYASLTTLRQIDMKRIIAYSSVSHMGLVTLAIFSAPASVFLMIAHGLTSSALFICVTLLYERTHTRIVKYYRGVAAVMPLFSMFFLVFSLANLGLPLTANFIGEFLSLLAISQYNPLLAALAATSVIFSAAYSLFLFNRVSFGSLSSLTPLRDLTRREFSALLPLVGGVILLGIYPDLLLGSLQ